MSESASASPDVLRFDVVQTVAEQWTSSRASSWGSARFEGEEVALVLDEVGFWWRLGDTWVDAPWAAVRSLVWDAQTVGVNLANGLVYRVPLVALREELRASVRASVRAWAPAPPAEPAEAPPMRAEPPVADDGPWALPRT